MKAIILSLILTTAAHAAPSCSPSTKADMLAAVGNNPEWPTIVSYATHKHFDFNTLGDVVTCTRDDGTPPYFIGHVNNRSPLKPIGGVLYDPSHQAGNRVMFTWKKGTRTYYTVRNTITERVRFNADGTPKSYILLDLHGHHLRPPVAPLARSRLQFRSLAALTCPLLDDAGCADYEKALQECIENDLTMYDIYDKASKIKEAYDVVTGCSPRNIVRCLAHIGVDDFMEMVIKYCLDTVFGGTCALSSSNLCVVTVGCHPGQCNNDTVGGPICAPNGQPSPCDACPSDSDCTWPSCMCSTTTTTTETTTTTVTTTTQCSNCPTEFCAVCGPVTSPGTPLPPGTGFGIFTSMNNCNQCCPNPVNVCHSTGSTICCFNRLQAGDLYCCPSSCTSDNPVCPQ